MTNQLVLHGFPLVMLKNNVFIILRNRKHWWWNRSTHSHAMNDPIWLTPANSSNVLFEEVEEEHVVLLLLVDQKTNSKDKEHLAFWNDRSRITVFEKMKKVAKWVTVIAVPLNLFYKNLIPAWQHGSVLFPSVAIQGTAAKAHLAQKTIDQDTKKRKITSAK